MLIRDGTIERQSVDLVLGRLTPDLSDHELHLIGLGCLRENRTQGLGIGVSEAATGDIAAVVGISAHISQAYAGNTKVLEFVVLADGRKSNPVVDLGDLVQGSGRILRDEKNSTVVLQDDNTASPGDSLACVIRLVLNDLLRRYVEGHAHEVPPGS